MGDFVANYLDATGFGGEQKHQHNTNAESAVHLASYIVLCEPIYGMRIISTALRGGIGTSDGSWHIRRRDSSGARPVSRDSGNRRCGRPMHASRGAEGAR